MEPALKKTEVSGEDNISSRPRLQMDQTIRLDLGSDLGLDSGPSLSSDLKPELNSVSNAELELRRKLIQFDGLISYRMMYEMIIRGLPSYEPEYIWSCFTKDMKVTMKDVLNGLQVLLDLGLIQKDGDRLVKGDLQILPEMDSIKYSDEFKIMSSKLLAIGGILAGRSDSGAPVSPGVVAADSNTAVGYLLDWCLPMTKNSYKEMIAEIIGVFQKYEAMWDPATDQAYEYFQVTTGIIQGTKLNEKHLEKGEKK